MANYRTEWQAISERIEGLLQAADVSQRLSQTFSDGEGYTDIVPHARRLLVLLRDYQRGHGLVLPQRAADALGEFIRRHRSQIDEDVSSDQLLGFLKRTLPALASIRAEVSHLLRDTQAVVMRMTERAFTHLQRSIIVDGDAKCRWRQAFEVGETRLEQLGAVHLLSHGIWAFKAYAEGERTDLVVGEPLTDLGQVAATAEGLVLTEWKKVADPNDLRRMADEAFAQAEIYGRSALAGVELADYAYLVLVSERREQVPNNRKGNARTYRHINIAVDPGPPSDEARRNGPVQPTAGSDKE